jgi:hypothetical protein
MCLSLCHLLFFILQDKHPRIHTHKMSNNVWGIGLRVLLGENLSIYLSTVTLKRFNLNLSMQPASLHNSYFYMGLVHIINTKKCNESARVCII